MCPLLMLAFMVPSMGLLATLIIKCTVRRAVPLPVLGINGKCKEWVPDWGGGSGDI